MFWPQLHPTNTKLGLRLASINRSSLCLFRSQRPWNGPRTCNSRDTVWSRVLPLPQFETFAGLMCNCKYGQARWDKTTWALCPSVSQDSRVLFNFAECIAVGASGNQQAISLKCGVLVKFWHRMSCFRCQTPKRHGIWFIWYLELRVTSLKQLDLTRDSTSVITICTQEAMLLVRCLRGMNTKCSPPLANWAEITMKPQLSQLWRCST